MIRKRRSSNTFNKSLSKHRSFKKKQPVKLPPKRPRKIDWPNLQIPRKKFRELTTSRSRRSRKKKITKT